MGQRNSADIIIRLALKDGGVREALKASGRDGEKALRKIDRAAKKARPSLKGVDAAAKDIKSRLLSSIKPLGAFGSGLKAIGPIGFGVAATLGIVTSALLLMSRAGAQAANELAAIGDTASEVGFAADAYQALAFEAAKWRISQSDVDSALKASSKTLSEAVTGSGEFFSAMNLLNPELVKQIQNTDKLEDQLGLIAKAYNEAGSETEKNTLLLRVFGDNGVRVGQMLAKMEGGLEGAIKRGKEMGIVFTESVIKGAQEASSQLAVADARIAASKKRLGIVWADEAAGMKKVWADFLDFVAGTEGEKLTQSYADQIKILEDKQKEFVEIAEQNKALLAGLDAEQAKKSFANKNLEQINKVTKGIEAQIKALEFKQFVQKMDADFEAGKQQGVKASAKLLADFNRLAGESTTTAQKRTAAEKVLAAAIASKAIPVTKQQIKQIKALIAERFKDTAAITKNAQKAREAAALLASQTRVADSIRASLFSTTEKLMAKEAEYQVLVKAGALSQTDANRALEKYRDSLDGTDTAIARVNSALAAAQTPQQIYDANIVNLELSQKRLNLTTEQTILLTERYAAARDKAIQAEAEAAEREKFGETLKDAQKRILETIKTSEEVIDAKIELQKKILKALGAAISDEDAAKFLKEYEEGLRKAADSSDKLNDSQRRMQSFMSQQIRSWADLKDAALDALQSMLKQWLLNKGKMSGGLFGSGAGSSGGGGFNLGTILASFFHDGTASVSPSARQGRVSAAEVATAPRYHSGKSSVGQDEQVAILQTRERIFSRSDNGSLIRAINNSTARSYAANDRSVGGVKIIINNTAAGVEVQTEDKGIDAEGMRQIELKMFRVGTAAAKKVLSDGSADAPLRNRYGIHRAGRRR